MDSPLGVPGHRGTHVRWALAPRTRCCMYWVCASALKPIVDLYHDNMEGLFATVQTRRQTARSIATRATCCAAATSAATTHWRACTPLNMPWQAQQMTAEQHTYDAHIANAFTPAEQPQHCCCQIHWHCSCLLLPPLEHDMKHEHHHTACEYGVISPMCSSPEANADRQQQQQTGSNHNQTRA